MNFINSSTVSKELQNQMWNIYQSSFPVHETREQSAHDLVMKDAFFFAQGVFEAEKLIAIIFFWKVNSFTYIEHFAIDSKLRGQQYGTRVLKEFCAQNENVVLEIEPPVDELTIKRERFYHHLGFVTTPYSYTYPSYRKGHKVQDLVVMTLGECMTQAEFEAFKIVIFDVIMKYNSK